MSSLSMRAAALAASTSSEAIARIAGHIAGEPARRLPPIARKVFTEGPLASAQGRAMAVRMMPLIQRAAPGLGLMALIAVLLEAARRELAQGGGRRGYYVSGECTNPRGPVTHQWNTIGGPLPDYYARYCIVSTATPGNPAHWDEGGVVEDHWYDEPWGTVAQSVRAWTRYPNAPLDARGEPLPLDEAYAEPGDDLAKAIAQTAFDMAPHISPMAAPSPSGLPYRQQADMRRQVGIEADPAGQPDDQPIRWSPPVVVPEVVPEVQFPPRVFEPVESYPSVGTVVPVDPDGRPVEVQADAGSGLSGITYVPSTHTYSPPPKGTKERKLAIRGAKWPHKIVMNAYTESHDFVSALWKALPRQRKPGGPGRRWGVTRIDSMLEDLMRNWDRIDWREATFNVVANQMEDRFIGATSRLVDRMSRGSGAGLDTVLFGGYGAEGVLDLMGVDGRERSNWLGRLRDRIALDQAIEQDPRDRAIRAKNARGEKYSPSASYQALRARQREWSRDTLFGLRSR